MDPGACRFKQADTIHQSSRKRILHRMREGGPEEKSTCEFAAFGRGAAGVAGKSHSPGDASFSTLLINQLRPPSSVCSGVSSNLPIIQSIIARLLVDFVRESGMRDALPCRHLAITSNILNAATCMRQIKTRKPHINYCLINYLAVVNLRAAKLPRPVI
jgi:hypothetical protein